MADKDKFGFSDKAYGKALADASKKGGNKDKAFQKLDQEARDQAYGMDTSKYSGDLRDVIQNKIEEKNIEVDNSNFRKAIFTVILADVTMSLDNVLGVAGAAKDHYTLLAFGLGLSILLMAFAANYTAKLIKKYSWISWVGLLAILIVSFQLIYEDLIILLWLDMHYFF